jgi:non-ribosomal peptide synthetase component F
MVVDVLQSERASREPLFRINLTLQPARGGGGGSGAGDLTLGEVTAEPLNITGDYARFDISIDVADDFDGSIGLSFEYSTEVFDADRIERLADHYANALAGGVGAPEERIAGIDVMPAAERAQVVSGWNPAPAPRQPGLLHHVLAGHDPTRVAIRSTTDGTELTYAELDQRSNQLAHALHQAGIGPGHTIGVLLDRGPHLPIAQLGILKAGAAFTPLDPQLPAPRLAFQISDAAAPLVLTTADLSHLVTGTKHWIVDTIEGPDTPPTVDTQPDDPAYLLYTSGTTGTPKGVLVSHRSAYAYCENAVSTFGTTPADRVVQVANPAFDMSVFDCYAALLGGATLICASRETVADPQAFTALLRDERVTVGYIPPTLLAGLDPADLVGSDLRALDIGGEGLTAGLANRWIRPGLDLHNLYGPTETTVACTD